MYTTLRLRSTWIRETSTPLPLCSLAQCLRHSSAPVLSSTLLSDLEL